MTGVFLSSVWGKVSFLFHTNPNPNVFICLLLLLLLLLLLVFFRTSCPTNSFSLPPPITFRMDPIIRTRMCLDKFFKSIYQL